LTVLISLLLLAVGLVILILGADALVRSAATLARRLGVSQFVVGVTVVAFGTSAPELFASAGAVLQNKTDIAIGNVVGSNIANILLILGAGAVIAPMALHRRVRLVEIPVMAAITLGAWVMLLDASLTRVEGAILVAGLCGYVYWVVRSGAIELDEDAKPTGSPLRDILFLIGGIVGLALGARALVDGSVGLARIAGVPEGIIGATIIAFGTSLPELAATVRAGLARQSDIAVGNIIGSNVFNLLCVLGICTLLRPLQMPDAMAIHLHAMGGVTVLFMFFALVRHMIGRIAGVIFLTGYLVYVGYLLYAILVETP